MFLETFCNECNCIFLILSSVLGNVDLIFLSMKVLVRGRATYPALILYVVKLSTTTAANVLI